MTILDQFGRPMDTRRPAPPGGFAVRPRVVRAKYDAAQTTDDNTRHWAASDSLSADQANSYAIRKKLRERARYETANNTTLGGIVDTYVDDTVGQAGPRLQLLTANVDLNDEVEREWRRWAAAARFGQKLRTLHRSRVVDGEGFALFITNPRLKHPVTLDLRVLECDRFHSTGLIAEDNNIDGVVLDEQGNAIEYHVLSAHPGGSEYTGFDKTIAYDAEWIIHWFRAWRSEQHRGVPAILAALPLAAYDRRFRLAVLAAAETCADISMLLYTEAPANGEAANVDEYSAMEIERNVMMSVPGGWKPSQMTPQQPAATYKEFKRETTTDMARPVAMPRNIAAGDSSDYNFASGRLDHGTYFKRIG
ncbi:MAG TPA: phage portal protein, partial [Phycisphaerae bacterium]|nr:phage portal protein [Phycisphaerae bacterium]